MTSSNSIDWISIGILLLAIFVVVPAASIILRAYLSDKADAEKEKLLRCDKCGAERKR